MLADWMLAAAPGFGRGQGDTHDVLAQLPRMTEVGVSLRGHASFLDKYQWRDCQYQHQQQQRQQQWFSIGLLPLPSLFRLLRHSTLLQGCSVAVESLVCITPLIHDASPEFPVSRTTVWTPWKLSRPL